MSGTGRDFLPLLQKEATVQKVEKELLIPEQPFNVDVHMMQLQEYHFNSNTTCNTPGMLHS